MGDVDAFAQRMLERAKARREKLDKQLSSVGEQTTAKKRVPLLESNCVISGANFSECFTKRSTPSPTKSSYEEAKRTSTASKPRRSSQGGRRFSKSPKKEATPPPPPHDDSESGTEDDEIGMHTDSDSETEISKSVTFDVKECAKTSVGDGGASITDGVRHRLRRLGALYSDSEQLSSPIHRTENNFSAGPQPRSTRNKSATRSARLAALASTINEWEDDLSHPTVATASARLNTSVSAESQGFTRTTSNSRLVYDFEEESQDSNVEAVALSSVERDDENEDEYESPAKSPVKKDMSSPAKTYNKFISPSRSPMVMGVAQLRKNASPMKQGSSSPASPVKSQFKVNLKPVQVDDSPPEGSVLQRAAKYESDAASPSKRLARDPAELPLSERMALFEKNKGPLLVPKVPFSTPMPAKLLKETAQPLPKSPQKPSTNMCPPIKEPVMDLPKSSNKLVSTIKQNIEDSGVLHRLKLFEAGRIGLEDSPSRPQNQAVAERKKEIELLSSRWNRNKDLASDDQSPPKAITQAIGTPPPPPPLPGSPLANTQAQPRRSPRRAFQDSYPGVTEVKRIKVSPPKPGNIYPSLSDMEATTETEEHSCSENSYDEAESSLESDISFGKDILEAAEKVHSYCRSQKDNIDDVSVTESMVLREMDDLLDDALDETTEDEKYLSPPKKTITTPSKKLDSFKYESEETVLEPVVERKSPRRTSSKYRAPQPPCTPSSSSEGQEVPLIHTVSFYRKQQNMTPRTPARQIQQQRSPEKSVAPQDCEQERHLVEVRVRSLLEEVSKQTTTISQASQALNLCNATIEFSGSAEQVEGERLLLLATHRRQAALNEIQRLKVEGTLRPKNLSGPGLSNFSEHGTLHISDITLPVKRDYVRSSAVEDNSHHFVCLAKCQDVVLATTVVSIAKTRDLQGTQTLCFPSSLSFTDLHTNFRVTLEVYTMNCRQEVLPHDVKYHINKKDSKRMTPKKHKQESHLTRPPVQSPAGPGAVRNTQFNLIGFVIFSVKEVQRTSFILNKVSRAEQKPVPYNLEGSISLRMKCDLTLDIEHCGFLNMYEVVSGYGFWHRRWCLLKGEMLSYWKYPEHEKTEVPIGSIDLRTCVDEDVGLAPKDICARLHTILLKTTRPAKPTDVNSLDMECHGKVTHIRHLLSADTREERIDWCKELNKALTVIRAWGKKSDE